MDNKCAWRVIQFQEECELVVVCSNLWLTDVVNEFGRFLSDEYDLT